MSLFDTFAQDSAFILSEIGREVMFRGVKVQAMVADPSSSEMLMVGGFSQNGSQQTFKFLRASYEGALPAEGELIGFPVVDNNAEVKWVINSVESRPLSAWVKMDCKRWDA